MVPGQPGWEDAEIHDSRKMSTLIIPYAREYHMGKYTLVAENPLGHAVSNADLIVRKKQFPPVFWQRLYNYEAESGTDFFISGLAYQSDVKSPVSGVFEDLKFTISEGYMQN